MLFLQQRFELFSEPATRTGKARHLVELVPPVVLPHPCEVELSLDPAPCLGPGSRFHFGVSCRQPNRSSARVRSSAIACRCRSSSRSWRPIRRAWNSTLRMVSFPSGAVRTRASPTPAKCIRAVVPLDHVVTHCSLALKFDAWHNSWSCISAFFEIGNRRRTRISRRGPWTQRPSIDSPSQVIRRGSL